MDSKNKLFTISKKWLNENGHSPITNMANLFFPISEGAIKYIDENTFEISIKKGKYLIKTGSVCEHIYFIQKGALRAFIKEGGKDITTWISIENELATSIRGFELQLPCLENIQAIEDCELVVGSYTDLQYLYTNFMEMNIVGRKIYEKYYRDSEERAFISRLPKASSKYLYFINTRGDLLNRIPLKYVASYLGMTMETLSRMRNSFFKKSKKAVVVSTSLEIQ